MLLLLASPARSLDPDDFDDDSQVAPENRPTKFVFMSGTMYSEVKHLAPYYAVIQKLVAAIRDIWVAEDNTFKLDQTRTKHDRIKKCDIATAKPTYTTPAEGSDQRAEVEIDSNIGKILADITIRRRQNTRIPEQRPFNTPLVLLPAMHDIVKRVTYPSNLLKECNERLVSLSQSVVKGNGNKSAKIATVERELIKQSHTIQIMASLPSLYRMMSEFKSWGGSLTQANMNSTIDHQVYLTTPLAQNTLRKRVRDSCDQDPKMVALRTIIDSVLATDAARKQEIRASRQKNPQSFPGAAADYLEKGIVTAQNTFTALATYDILQKAYPNIEIAMHHSLLSDKEKVRIIEGFTDQRDQDGNFKQAIRPRILVAVQFPISTGLNLQRANTIISLEPCGSPSEEAQMRCRVLRIGQLLECYLYRLHVEGLRFEEVITNRRTRREMLKEAARLAGMDMDEE